MPIRHVAAVAAAFTLLGGAVTALASSRGTAASTQRCFDFTVVQPDPWAQFAAGTYHRSNFSPGNSLSCDATYHLFRSYLYDPPSLRGWTVGPLTGSLRGQIGKRFVKNGTRGTVGFNIYRNNPTPAPKTVIKTVNMQPNTTQTYSVYIPTRTPEIAETVQLVNGAGAQILQSGFRVSGRNTVYFATVQTPNLAGYRGQAQFKLTVQS
jgi:hypothetical protein